jgi:hypothetical protein
LEESLRADRLHPREIEPVGARRTALDAMAAQLHALAGREDAESTDATDANTPRSMDETLRTLAEQLAQATVTERQALSDRLNQVAAQAAQAGNRDLAQALADMARAARQGDAEAVSQAAQAASEAIARERGDLAAQSARERVLSQLQQSRESLAAAGSGQGQPSQGTSSAQLPGEGESDRTQLSGQGQGPSAVAGQGQGQGTGGQGTKADRLPPGTGRGEASRPQGEGRSGQAESLDQQIYAPFERRPSSGDQVTISGQDTGQGETEVRERSDPLPGSSSEALVPYTEVYYDYRDVAIETIEQSYIPSGLKDVVREYFSRLEP